MYNGLNNGLSKGEMLVHRNGQVDGLGMGLVGQDATMQGYAKEARDFFLAAQISDGIQRRAINNLVKNLKANNLWDRFLAIYPIVGGAAFSHKFNLKNPIDSDSAFRLTFSGTITHSKTGMAGNGISGYYDTNLNDSLNLTQDSISVFIYSRTNLSLSNTADIYAGIPKICFVNSRNGSNLMSTNLHCTFGDTTANINSDSRGLFGVTRNISTQYRQWQNNANNIVLQPSTGMANDTFKGMVDLNQNVYNTREQAFISIGAGLLSTEVPTFYNIIQDYQTALSRQV